MKTKSVEMQCDYCGNCDHYPPGHVDAMARDNGWIITRDGKHFDSKECYSASKVKAE